jgi:hypothetical protein
VGIMDPEFPSICIISWCPEHMRRPRARRGKCIAIQYKILHSCKVTCICGDPNIAVPSMKQKTETHWGALYIQYTVQVREFYAHCAQPTCLNILLQPSWAGRNVVSPLVVNLIGKNSLELEFFNFKDPGIDSTESIPYSITFRLSL